MAKDEEMLARYRAEEMERDDRRRREEAEWEERCYQAQVAAAREEQRRQEEREREERWVQRDGAQDDLFEAKGE